MTATPIRAPLFLLFASLPTISGGCGPRDRPAAKTSAPGRARAITDYKLVGVVRAVDVKAGRVRIDHEAVPGFMDAMEMPFTIKDRADLDDVRPGDEVEATLRVERENGEVADYELKNLIVVRPAPRRALALNLAGGRPEIAPVPRTLTPGERVPDFTMTDQNGATRKLSDDRGKVVALTFIFTRCPLPDFCPRMDRKFSELAGQLPTHPALAARARLLSVSFDPAHDTPAVLKEHARSRGATPPLWTFAVATHPELARVAPALGLVYGPRKDDFIHNLVVAVIDPDGRLVAVKTGASARDWTPADLIKSMYSCLPRSKE